MVGHRTSLAQEWPSRRDAREDQEMKEDYWKNFVHRFSAKSQLVSLCLSSSPFDT